MSSDLEKLYDEATGSDSFVSKPEKEVSSLEDLGMAQPDKDFTPPKNEAHDQTTFDPEEMLEDRREEEFMETIKTGNTPEKLATILENYGKDNNIPDMQIQASKIRKGALPETITREFGIRDQYQIVVDGILDKPSELI